MAQELLNFEILAIQNYSSSGALFLQSLLDSHPAILAIPGTVMTIFPQFWPDIAELSGAEKVQVFIRRFHHLFRGGTAYSPIIEDQGLNRLGPEQDQRIGVDPARFAEALHGLVAANGADRNHFFLAIHTAYAIALGREVRAARYILWPVHGMSQPAASAFLASFRRVRFIHTMRHVADLFGSGVRHIRSSSAQTVHAPEGVLKQLFLDTAWTGEKQVCGDRPYDLGRPCPVAVVRLEDLHREPRQTLEALCCWLEIDWSDTLLESTFDGKQWWNRSGSDQVSGFRPASAGRWNDRYLWRLDRYRLCLLADARLRRWGYPLPPLAGSMAGRALSRLLAWLPFKAELALPPMAQRLQRFIQHCQTRNPPVDPDVCNAFITERLLEPAHWAARHRECIKQVRNIPGGLQPGTVVTCLAVWRGGSMRYIQLRPEDAAALTPYVEIRKSVHLKLSVPAVRTTLLQRLRLHLAFVRATLAAQAAAYVRVRRVLREVWRTEPRVLDGLVGAPLNTLRD